MDTVFYSFLGNYSTCELAFAAISSVILFAFIAISLSTDETSNEFGCGGCLGLILLVISVIDLVYFYGKTLLLLLLLI